MWSSLRTFALVAVLNDALDACSGSFLRLGDQETSRFDCGKVVTDRPLIGVFTQPDAEDGEYVAGSYVKYLESAGARVVAIRYGWNETQLREAFSRVNGLFFPGGAAPLEAGSTFFEASKVLFKLAVDANVDGDFFPVWGTCLGFEQLMILGAGADHSVLSAGFDSEDLAGNIKLTQDGKLTVSKGSGLLGGMDSALLKALQSENIAFNSHEMGVEPSVFSLHPRLSEVYTALATDFDRKGREFVMAFEGRGGLPIYGTQFHPEKSVFEWHLPNNIPHSENAVLVSQYLSNFFVSKSRCNAHRFPGGYEEESAWLIQGTASKRIFNATSYFMEKFIF